MRPIGLWVAAFLLLTPTIAQAASDPTAEAFVRGLYQRYRGTGPDYLGKDAPSVFDKSLVALFQRDRAAAKGEAGLMDWDPICDCQDPEGLTGVQVAVRPSGDEATARFAFGSRAVTIEYKLVHTAAGWRIADIGSAKIPSLRDWLTQGLQQAR